MNHFKKVVSLFSLLTGMLCVILIWKTEVQAETKKTENGLDYCITNDEVVITGYSGTETVVTIPSKIDEKTVIEIGDSAFNGNDSLAKIVLPNSLKTISCYAFSSCKNLSEIELPESLETIGYGAFIGCESLTNIIIPSGMKQIGYAIFAGCKNLTSVSIPESVLEIKGAAFENCDNIVILCNENSAAAAFASENNIPTFPLSYAENPFDDISIDKYYSFAVRWAFHSDPQITTGTSDTAFSPSKTCNRAQVVTFLWRLVGEPEPESTKNPFTDVKETDYFYKAVLWANETGVTTGTSDTTFSPKSPCKRSQFVTFLWRACGSPAPAGTDNPFEDVEPGKYYTDAVLWANEKGITTGTDETHFSPGKEVSRGQAVTFLFRARNQVEK